MDRGVTKGERRAKPVSGSGRSTASDGTAPTELGPYRILDSVGTGGMGIVFRAVHRDTGVEAALKTVRAIDPSLLAGLRREVRALSRLEHAGIVRILDEGLADATPWYAMELLEGETLRSAIRDAAAPAPSDGEDTEPDAPPATTTVVSDAGETLPDRGNTPAAASGSRRARPSRRRQPPTLAQRDALLGAMPRLCDALAFLHGEGVAHLDLKPDNVFLTGGGPVLMDFGLAARSVAVHGRENLDVVARGLGTMAYIAPEQLSGEVVDARADLYALGCILYEIVTGEPPFAADNPLAVAYSHLEIPAAPPSERAPDVSGELDALILGLLRKAPEDRIGYASDVARELRGALPDAPPPRDERTPRSYLYRPRLVSRDAPLHVLREALDRARAGAASLALVGGESGVGKTRLVTELARREGGEEILVLTGECTSLGVDEAHGAPLAPFADVFQAIADRVRDGTDAELDALLVQRGPVLASFAPAIRDLPTAAEWTLLAPLPARAARARVVRAATDALVALARRQPIILILDDVHWADDLSIAILETLAAEADGLRAPLFVVATYRSDEATPALIAMAETEGVTAVRLGRLDAEGARAMVDGMLGRGELPSAMVDQVSNHAEGNPFFIAEYLRAAVREGVIERVDGQWTANDPDGSRVAALPMPGSIQDLVRRRLERLGPLAREVVEVAAVIGRDHAPEDLAPHVDATEADVADALLELVASQMHEPVPDGRLRFVHAKLHEGVYASMRGDRRVALHRSVADGIEATPPRPGRSALLAHHLVAAEEHARAVDALEAAALEALGNGSYGAAEALLERARTLADQHGLAIPSLRRARWDRGLGDCRFALGDLGGAAERGRAALERLGHELPPSAVGATLAVLREGGRSALGRAVPAEEAEALVEASLGALRVAEAGYYQLDAVALLGGSVLATTLAGRAGAEARAAKAYAMLGVVLASLGMRDRSTRLCDRAIGYAEAGDEPATLAFTLYAKAINDTAFCDLDAARALSQRAIEVAREVGDEFDAGIAVTILGHVEYWSGDLEGSARRYRALAETARSVRATQHEAWGLYAEARSLVHTGDCARAVVLCRAAQEKLVGQNDAASELICEAILAWALFGTGARADALRAARSASERIAASKAAIWPNLPGYAAAAEVWLALAPTEPDALSKARAAQRALAGLVRGAPIAETAALLYDGRIALAEGAPRRAKKSLERAVRLASERGLKLDEGMARLALASALDGDAAARARREARAALESIGAHRHLEGASTD